MATKTIQTCDVCGTDASTTASLTIDGATTEVDLCAKHTKELTAATRAFVSVGRTIGRSRAMARTGATKASTVKKSAPKKSPKNAARKKSPSVAIRAWANANGVPVGLKGVVRKEVVDAYNAAKKK